MGDLTSAQERAVRALSGDIAISAGAGSGKTRVIAHRFAYALAAENREECSDIDGILTITFTSKAAGEIAERVRRVLADEGEHALARRIDEAWISTIHVLCSRLVRRHALELEVSPRFQVADEATAGLLRAEAWERTARDAVARDHGCAELFALMGHKAVWDSCLGVLGQLRAMGAAPADLRIPFGSLEDEMIAAAQEFDALALDIDAATTTAARAASAAALRGYSARLRAGDQDAAREIAFSRKSWKNEPNRGIDGANAEVAIARMRSCIGEAEYAWIPEALQELIASFDREYSALKSQREILDFDDLQEFAARLLADERLARQYRDRFRLVMVDEFQDTNRLQMRVIGRLSDGNLCVVGDDRQSIYGWRYADVGVFTRAREEADVRESLDTNFRSHEQVLSFTNGLFSTKPFWSDYMRLTPGRVESASTTWPTTEPRVEIMLVQKGEALASKAAAIEADAVASRIVALVASGIDAGDIVVLLRSSTYADTFAAALSRAGVEVLQSAGGSFFEVPEVEDLRALLRVVALPYDDEALARVLAGDLVGLSADGLWRVRWAATTGAPLWEGVGALVSSACEGLSGLDARALDSAHKLIEELRLGADRWGLAELLRKAVDGFDYDLVLLSRGARGRSAWANVLKLIRIANAYEQVELPDPLAFERYLERRDQYSIREAQGATAVSGNGAVRIMTVHAAKGLEFPVVIVPDLGRGVTVTPHGRFLVGAAGSDGTVPLGFKMPDPAGRLTEDSLERIRLAEQYAADTLAEEKRIFYVACTRASEALILSGTTGVRDSRLSWVTDSLHPASEASGLATLGAVTVRVREVEAPPSEMSVKGGGGATVSTGRASSDSPYHSRIEQAREILGREATCGLPARHARAMPGSVSYSSLHEYGICRRRFYVRHVLGLRSDRLGERSNATRFGSAVHAALLKIGSSGLLDAATLDAVARGFDLSPTEQERLSAAVASYLDSEVARQVARAERVFREQPFAIGLAGTSLEGSIDVVAWTGAGAHIVDYKTGTSELGADARAAYRAQAECYALAALAAGADRVRATFVRLERPGEILEFTFDASQRNVLTAGVQAVLDEMAAGRYEPLEAYDHAACGECPAYQGLCGVGPSGQRCGPRS